jgi:hypothetical protein
MGIRHRPDFCAPASRRLPGASPGAARAGSGCAHVLWAPVSRRDRRQAMRAQSRHAYPPMRRPHKLGSGQEAEKAEGGAVRDLQRVHQREGLELWQI